jgi:hypothetical protein
MAEDFMAKAAHANVADESERFPFLHIVKNDQETDPG